MDRNQLVVGVALVLVVGLGLAAAVGPLGVLDGDGSDAVSETPTAPVGGDAGSGDSGNGGSGGGSSAAGDGTPTPPPPLELAVESVEACGRTCRDVTASLANNQERRATGITVDTTIYAGEDADGDVVWEGSREVGTLDPGESATDTSRIELGWFEAAAVQSAGGQVTIETVVESDRRSRRFVERRDVS